MCHASHTMEGNIHIGGNTINFTASLKEKVLVIVYIQIEIGRFIERCAVQIVLCVYFIPKVLNNKNIFYFLLFNGSAIMCGYFNIPVYRHFVGLGCFLSFFQSLNKLKKCTY